MMSYVTGDIFVWSPPKQTLQAWRPLDDCRSILFEFQNSDVDEERAEWRPLWVAGIALLRTVGHVLSKVDSSQSVVHKAEIEALWAEWKADPVTHSIFWDFIEKERNNLLKTYAFGAKLVRGSTGYVVTYTTGENAFHLFREAVYWWRHQLSTLESRT